MTDQSIGTARLDLVVTTDKLDAAIESAKRSVSGMSAQAQSDYNKMNAAEKRRADSFLRTAANIRLTKEEQIAYNAALKGMPVSILDELKKRLAFSNANAQGLTKAFSGTNKSARELQFAMRGLPAQVTDIFTSLASGQRPMMVLLQQGGQLKDMFGGVVPAARALGGAVAGLINPITLAIGAVVGLGLAWKNAEDEAANFQKAIALTGNSADLTTQQLRGMASEIDATTNATAGKASDVLAQVAATGKFTSDQIQLIAKAAVNLEDATGRSIEKTIADFVELEKDPVAAIRKLNNAVGDGTNVVGFLTRAQLESINRLKEQGNEAKATAESFEVYADAINTATPQVVENLSDMTLLWRDIKQAVKEAGDSVSDFFRNSQASSVAARSFRSIFHPLLPDQKPKSLDPIFIVPDAAKVNEKTEKAREEAEKEFGQLRVQNLSKAAKLEEEIADIREKGLKAGKSEADIARVIADARQRYKESLPKGRKAGSDGIESATARAAIQAFEDQLKKEQGLIQNQTKLLEANYAARNITVERYYAEQKRLAQENNAAQVKALEGEIAALQSRSLKGKDSINNARELAEKEALLAKVRADGATALEVLNIQEAAQLKQRQQANIAYADALDSGREALKAELDSQVLRISVGEREFEIRSRIIQLYRDEAKELLNLARQRDAGEIDPETYKARVEQLKAAIADEVQIVKDGYDQMAKAQANWANGALKAFADYRDAANDVAGQTYSIFNDALSGLEDVFVDFFTKGKADWKGFFDSIAADITRFIVRQQLSKLVSKFLPGAGEGDNAQALSGAATQLAASAAPLYGAAAALSASAAALAAAGTGQSAASGSSGGGGWFGALLSMFGSSGSSSGSSFSNAFANGGAFAGGVQYFARGDVFDSPTAFGMRSGIGVMGEAGPEAVMPLKRGSDGRLGVEVHGAREPRRITRGGDTYIQVQGAPNKQTLKQLERANGRGARREMARTGS